MEVFLRPLILIVFTLVGIGFAVSAFSREVTATDDESGLKTYKYSYAGKRGLIGALIVLAGVIVWLSVVVVPAGHRGITFSQWAGISHNERGEGLSLQVPLLQNTTNMSVREQLFEASLPMQTKDLQEVLVPIGVNFVIDPDRAAEMYQEVGSIEEFKELVVKVAVDQITKAEVGQINAIDFAQARNQLAIDIATALEPRLSVHGARLTFLSVEDAEFQPLFIDAVQAKVISVEEAQKQKNLVAAAISVAEQNVATAEGEKLAAILVAEGERAAIEAIASALGFTTAEYLEWVLKTRWNGIMPGTVVGVGDFGVLLEIGATGSVSAPPPDEFVPSDFVAPTDGAE